MQENTTKDIENTKAQIRKGILDYCVLLVISKGKIYANEILTQLKVADLIVVEGTLYPLLSRLKKAGLLEHTWEESPSGPPRKYYKLTKRGFDVMEELSKTWRTLSRSINSLMRKSS